MTIDVALSLALNPQRFSRSSSLAKSEVLIVLHLPVVSVKLQEN